MTEEQKDRFDQLLARVISAAQEQGMEIMTTFKSKFNMKQVEDELNEAVTELETFIQGL